MHCVIIGSGFAGISAAVSLLPFCRVTIIEQRPTIGGRANSIFDPTAAEMIDNGQHLLMGCYTATRQLLQRLGTDALLYRWSDWIIHFRTADGCHASIQSSSFFPAFLSFPWSLLRFSLLTKTQRRQLLQALYALLFQRLPRQTAAEFFRHTKQPARIQEVFWEPLILATTNATPSQIDIRLIRTVLREAFLHSAEHAAFLFPRVGLSELLSPVRLLLQQYNGTLRFRSTAIQLQHRGDIATTLHLSSGEQISADAFIFAIPPNALAKIEGAPHFPAFAYSPILTLYLWFEQWLDLPPMTALIGMTPQWVFHRQKLQFHTSPRFATTLVLVISAADAFIHQPARSLVDRCWNDIREIFHLSPQLQPAHYKVMRERWATVRLDPVANQQRPDTRTTLSNVFLAGDWIQTGLPATIEGAVRSGQKAAQAVRQYLEQRTRNTGS